MKTVNIDGESLHIFWTTMMILEVTKNQGFTLSIEDTFLENPQGELRV